MPKLKLKKMKTVKMSLANLQGKMSRKEMKNIMAGSGSDDCNTFCDSDSQCRVKCHTCKPIPNWAGKKACDW